MVYETQKAAIQFVLVLSSEKNCQDTGIGWAANGFTEAARNDYLAT